MKLNKFLFSKINNTSVIDLFRFFWGIIMIAYFLRFFTLDAGSYYYFNTVFHFRYPLFDWLPVLPDIYLRGIMLIGIISGISFTLGLFYKRSAILLFLCYTYIFLIDVSYWNNHYYLFALINLFFVVTNMYSNFSLDVKWRKKENTIFAWELLLFQLQISLVYLYGFISKISNPEWLNLKSVSSIYESVFIEKGIFLSENAFHYTILFISISGILFDLFIPFLLFIKNKKIKKITFLSVTIFHLTNLYLLKIGLFPYAMIATLLLFVNLEKSYSESSNVKSFKTKYVTPLFIIFFIIQTIIPLRHFFIKGNVFWTGEGKLFSWHMMSGYSQVLFTDFKIFELNENNEIIHIHELDLNNFLNYKQKRTIATHPYLAPQFFNFLKDEAIYAGMANVEIKGAILVNRNSKGFRHIISPKKDLTKLKTNFFKHNEWILLYKDEYF